jgi:hypothetical protein
MVLFLHEVSRALRVRTLALLVLALSASVAIPIDAFAHHSSISLYDRSGDIEITGIVKKVAWVNPHVRILVTVTDASGKDVDWILEAADAAGLLRRGMPKGVVNVGDRISAAGYPSKRGEPAIWTMNVLLADGREMLVYETSKARWSDRNIGIGKDTEKAPVVRRDDPAPDIFGVWFSTAGFEGNKDAGVWGGDIVLTPKGQAVQAAYDPGKENPFISCVRGIPEIMTGFGPLEFVQQDDGIVLRFEEFDIVRPIHMGPHAEANRPALAQPAERGAVGYSTGRWDDDGSLVVRTAGMSFPYYDQSGLPQSPNAEIVERWTLADEGNQLRYELTVIDPETFVKPVVQTKTWNWAPDQEVSAYNCDPNQQRPEQLVAE